MSELKPPKVLLEDDFLLVIDKPTGWVVNRASSVKQKTIQDWMEETGRIVPGDEGPFYQRSGMVHRLDKVTSGVLILAKQEEAFFKLIDQFRLRQVEKEYLALAHGRVSAEKGTIDLPIERKSRNRHQFGVVLGGRPALTRYEVKKRFWDPKKQPVTLLSLFPKTGRTHQLRVHSKHLGHPLVGDLVYGGRKNIQTDRSWCDRLFLHAHRIRFTHPQTGQPVEVTSPLPEELERVLASLKEEIG